MDAKSKRWTDESESAALDPLTRTEFRWRPSRLGAMEIASIVVVEDHRVLFNLSHSRPGPATRCVLLRGYADDYEACHGQHG